MDCGEVGLGVRAEGGAALDSAAEPMRAHPVGSSRTSCSLEYLAFQRTTLHRTSVHLAQQLGMTMATLPEYRVLPLEGQVTASPTPTHHTQQTGPQVQTTRG